MTHKISQKLHQRIKAILGENYPQDVNSLLHELHQALLVKKKAFQPFLSSPTIIGDNLEFFEFFLDGLLVCHEENSSDAVKAKLHQIAKRIDPKVFPPSHVFSYYALSILFSIGTIYLTYVLIAIDFPVIAGAAIPYLLHHGVLTNILSVILFIYTVISAITARDNQDKNQVKASLKELLASGHSKLDFPPSKESPSPSYSSLEQLKIDERKEDNSNPPLDKAGLKYPLSLDSAIVSPKQITQTYPSGGGIPETRLVLHKRAFAFPGSMSRDLNSFSVLYDATLKDLTGSAHNPRVIYILMNQSVLKSMPFLRADTLSRRRNDSYRTVQIEEVEKDKDKENFKKWGKDELIKSMTPYAERYHKNMLNEFFNYWAEPLANGKLRLTAQDAWDTGRRLVTWSKRDKDNKPQNAVVTRASMGVKMQ